MHTLPRHTLSFAIALSALAGCVDAIGFVQLGGFFISFMSGNSTRLAVGLEQTDWSAVGMLLAIIACFVAGAALGTTVRSRAPVQRQAASVLAAVTMLLILAAACNTLGIPSTAMLLVAVAMGTENAVLQSNGDNVIGVTYMTGTLVKMGQRIATALQGGEAFSWVPYLLLWLGLIAGGITGALLFTHLGFNALWVAAAWALLLTVGQRFAR